jgi:hypothetical protein
MPIKQAVRLLWATDVAWTMEWYHLPQPLLEDASDLPRPAV